VPADLVAPAGSDWLLGQPADPVHGVGSPDAVKVEGQGQGGLVPEAEGELRPVLDPHHVARRALESPEIGLFRSVGAQAQGRRTGRQGRGRLFAGIGRDLGRLSPSPPRRADQGGGEAGGCGAAGDHE
jgi:hypothetical protein